MVLFSSSEIFSLHTSHALKDCRPFHSEDLDFPLSRVFHCHPKDVKYYCLCLVKLHNDNSFSVLRDICVKAVENQTP